MDFTKMFMSCINTEAINNLTDAQLNKVSAIFAKSPMYNVVEIEDEDEE